jgi:predicted nucleic acid-binding protein
VSVTLDTNVYVSALNFGGRASRLLGLAEAGTLVIDISEPIEQELARVLREDTSAGRLDQALGITQAVNDLNGDGVVNAADVQIEMSGALGLGCGASVG